MAQELKDYDIMDIEAMDDERLENSSSGRIFVTRVYIKDEVDAVLAEKDAEIRRLKRALYKACANWAMAEAYSVLHDVQTANRWVHALNKCRGGGVQIDICA